MGLNAIKSIEQLDSIPDDIANMIADNKERNNKIVKHYVKNKDKYGQTILFAINRMHAFALKGLFEKYGIKAAVIVSGTTAEFIGIDISDAENLKNIEDYRNGNIQVLINVNILTEGVDLPKNQDNISDKTYSFKYFNDTNGWKSFKRRISRRNKGSLYC